MLQACFVGALRGMDSTGVFAVPYDERKEDIIIYKKAMAGPDFMQINKVGTIMNNLDFYKFFIGHHRAATQGKVTAANAHPFNIDHITLVHNGTITSPYSYHKDHLNFQVDSELIAHVIAKEGYKEALTNITGGAALVWYDKKENTLNLFRNAERPLYFLKVKGAETTFIASESHMLKWLLYRNNIQVEGVFEIKADTVCQFTDKALPEKVEEIPKKKVVTYTPNWEGFPNNTDYRNMGWKRKNRFTMNEALEDAKVKLGDKIDFQYESMEFNSNKSRHGTLEGTCLKHPYFPVICHNVDPRTVQGVTVLRGTVIGAKPGDLLNTYEIIVNELEYIHGTKLLPKAKPEEEMVVGPNNKQITKKEFNELVKHGCSNCQVGLLPSVADLITWKDNQTPLCKTCAFKLDMKNDASNLSQFH